MSVRVHELMTRECRACDASDSLGSAAIRMWEADCGILPVVEDGRVVAVITDRDICMALVLKGCRPDERNVAEVASGELFTCAPEEDLDEALATMGRKKVRRLPVLEKGRLVGMLSLNDVVTCAGENPTLREPILGALERICAHRTLPAAA